MKRRFSTNFSQEPGPIAMTAQSWFQLIRGSHKKCSNTKRTNSRSAYAVFPTMMFLIGLNINRQ